MTYRKGGEGFLSQINLGNTGLMVLVFLTEGFFQTPCSASVLYESSREGCSISQVFGHVVLFVRSPAQGPVFHKTAF